MKKLSKIQLRKFQATELGEDQMKMILGGSGADVPCVAESCGGDCQYTLGNGLTYSGKCEWVVAGEYMHCACSVS